MAESSRAIVAGGGAGTCEGSTSMWEMLFCCTSPSEMAEELGGTCRRFGAVSVRFRVESAVKEKKSSSSPPDSRVCSSETGTSSCSASCGAAVCACHPPPLLHCPRKPRLRSWRDPPDSSEWSPHRVLLLGNE